jgi:hypothetical protein
LFTLRRRRALKSVQLAKRGFGKSRGCVVINVSQFLPKFNRYKNLGKIERIVINGEPNEPTRTTELSGDQLERLDRPRDIEGV